VLVLNAGKKETPHAQLTGVQTQGTKSRDVMQQATGFGCWFDPKLGDAKNLLDARWVAWPQLWHFCTKLAN
jgi:hypothetical protein